MTFNSQNLLPFWHLLTRLGEMQILLPAALVALVTLLRRPEARPLASWWIVFLLIATTVTTVSKIAFIGWGMGSAELDFTGFSGHAMFSAAIYPLLLSTLASHASPTGQRFAFAAGFMLAVLIGISRVEIGVHSASEVMAGLLLGGTASTLALTLARLPRAVISPIIPALIAIWLVIMPIHAPALQTHSWVTQLALKLSGNKTPYTRGDMLREL